jgi:hypothetical protein
MMKTSQAISYNDVKRGHEAFVKNEPRDLFYRAATELVHLAYRDSVDLTVAEAIAVLLQTWNGSYYRFHKIEKGKHFADVEDLLRVHLRILESCRDRSIDTLDNREETVIGDLFDAFESILGPVGAAKALHLLAPRFFPLWDRAIAKAYGLPLRQAGFNRERYWAFMLKAEEQCRNLDREDQSIWNPLKWIDEYNYSKYTKGWLV